MIVARAARAARAGRGLAKGGLATGGLVVGLVAGLVAGAPFVSAEAAPFARPALDARGSTPSAVEKLAPPWADPEDVPVPTWAKSVAPTKLDVPIFVEPGTKPARRGAILRGARLPLFATKLADGCASRWLNVGPSAWVCSDAAEYAREEPTAPPLGASDALQAWLAALPSAASTGRPSVEPATPKDDGLPYRYFFVGAENTYAYANLDDARDDVPEHDLERGFAIAIVEQKAFEGELWGRTKTGRWVAMRALVPARPSTFHGALVPEGKLDFGWISAPSARVFDSERATKSVGTKARFERVTIREEHVAKGGSYLRISTDDEPARWVRARDVARPTTIAPPAEIGGENASERWIDVELATQTLTAYEGTTPVFATLVSTGKGPPGSATATHPGVHRIWVKLFTTTMDNLDDEDPEHRYAIEDVPWVQFFDKGIALHAAFWHRDFGHVHSHGCVNLSPLDARWLFVFTAPHLPRGWSAVHPTKLEPSTVVRVR